MTPRLGLRENLWQFSLLVVANAIVGGMIGMERSILPALAEQEFDLAARTGILSFIAVFGITKALSNYFAGRASETHGRKPVLVAGWLVAVPVPVPVPFMLMYAPAWNWILAANVLLGISQGLTWSTSVIMKIDLSAPGTAAWRWASTSSPATSPSPTPRWPPGGSRPGRTCARSRSGWGVEFVVAGLGLSVMAVRETRGQEKLVRVVSFAAKRKTSQLLALLECLARARDQRSINERLGVVEFGPEPLRTYAHPWGPFNAQGRDLVPELVRDERHRVLQPLGPVGASRPILKHFLTPS